MQPKLIFVVGVWRSGTSLLHALLHNHPQIALMYEAEPFGLFPSKPDQIFPGDWTTRLEFFNQTFSRHRLDQAAQLKNCSARECALALYRAWAKGKNATVMGDKSPSYHRYLPEISRLFPEADFIVIWRDPLDTCRSVMNAGKQNRFFSRKEIMPQAFFGSEQLARGVLHLRAAKRRVHEVVYPELVSDPEGELRKICDFIGLEFDARMLDLTTADYSMLPPGAHHLLARSGAVKREWGRREILPERFIAKGQRYAVAWRERYSELAFARALPVLRDASQLGFWETWLDGNTYRACWSLTHFKHLVNRRMPIPIWQRLRSLAKPPKIENSLNGD
jgi:hypothetical protein